MLTFLMHVAQIGVFVFSFRFFIRNLDESLVKRRIKPKLMTKIVTAFVLFALVGLFFSKFFVLWMLFVLFSGQLFVHFVHVLRNKRIENEVLLLVQHIILNISAGNSFKKAYFHSISQLNPNLKHQFQSIWELQTLSNEEFPGIRTYKLSLLVRQCRENSSSCLDLMKEFRRSMKVEDNFLLKINSGLSQIRTQIGFISFFYVGLLLILFRMGLQQNYWEWVLLSCSLFLIGSLWAWYLPRGFKWSN